jgi:hypothetical protein
MNIEKLKNKAEQSWVDCDGCSQDDRQMWINGYLAGALSNKIELPSDEDIIEQLKGIGNDEHKLGFSRGICWAIDYIKQQSVISDTLSKQQYK